MAVSDWCHQPNCHQLLCQFLLLKTLLLWCVIGPQTAFRTFSFFLIIFAVSSLYLVTFLFWNIVLCSPTPLFSTHSFSKNHKKPDANLMVLGLLWGGNSWSEKNTLHFISHSKARQRGSVLFQFHCQGSQNRGHQSHLAPSPTWAFRPHILTHRHS